MLYTLAEALAAGALPSPAALHRRVLIKGNGTLPPDHPPADPHEGSDGSDAELEAEIAKRHGGKAAARVRKGAVTGAAQLHPEWAALVAIPLAPFRGAEAQGPQHVAVNLAEGRCAAILLSSI